MYNLFLRSRSKKGFTLMEMLIVVAIIAILIAIAIPVFSAQIEKAREAVDTANERSIKSMAVADAMLKAITANTKYYGKIGSDASTMTITSSSTAPTPGYGQGTAAGSNKTNVAGKVFSVTVDPTYNVTATAWE